MGPIIFGAITLPTQTCNLALTRRDRVVVDFTWYHVKNKTKLTNFGKLTRIEWHNGKYGSNPHGNMEILDVFFEIDQIGR